VSTPRFFVDAALSVGESLALPADVAHHALRVLRLREGEAIVLFNGRGGEYRSTLRTEGPTAVAQIDAFDAVEREAPLALTLIQALVAADKLDWIVEKAVELGAARIIVAPMQRSVVRLDAARRERRLQHWSAVVRAACSQCGRNRLPPVDLCATFDEALARSAANGPRFVLLPGAGNGLPLGIGESQAVLLVGPEGGLSDPELRDAERAGFIPVHLGPRILKTETAGLAAMAVLQAAGGDLVPSER
jgi:16S rRNA (uracil1498-N3)-methyltransferase